MDQFLRVNTFARETIGLDGKACDNKRIRAKGFNMFRCRLEPVGIGLRLKQEVFCAKCKKTIGNKNQFLCRVHSFVQVTDRANVRKHRRVKRLSCCCRKIPGRRNDLFHALFCIILKERIIFSHRFLSGIIDAIRRKGIGLDRPASGLQILRVNAADQVRLCE